MPSPDTRLIAVSASDTIDSIIAQIKSEPRPLIILLGDYDVSLDPMAQTLGAPL